MQVANSLILHVDDVMVQLPNNIFVYEQNNMLISFGKTLITWQGPFNILVSI